MSDSPDMPDEQQTHSPGVGGRPPQPEPGDRVGPYRLVRRIGKGGMAEVFEARREEGPITRSVAIKFMACAWSAEDPTLAQRFHAEGQILAALNHPNIARLLDGGVTPDGRQYVVMEYLRGVTLDVFLRRDQPPLDQRIALFLDLCDAVQYAHAHLIVHRDIKPANILITDEARLKLLDFGIAKLLRPEFWHGVEAAVTIPANRLATPEFAAPEQLSGDTVTTASDIYALGIILYYLLAERLPYEVSGKTWAEIDELVRTVDPRPIGGSVPGDLEAIARLALRRGEHAGHYSSVEHLADDIRRFQEHKPVRARQGNWFYPASRFIRRHRVSVALAATLLLTLAGSTVMLSRTARQLASERGAAEEVTGLLWDLFETDDPNSRQPRSVREVLDDRARIVTTQLASKPRIQARLAEKLGDLYRQRGHYAEAEPLARLALQRFRETSGKDSPEAARNMVRLADLLRETQRYEEAEALALESVAARKKHLGPEHEDVADSLNILGVLHQIRGDQTRAEAVFREAVAIRRAVFKTPNPLMALSLGNLGNILRDKQDLTGAEACFREALAIRQKTMGPIHPAIASSLGQLSQVALARQDAAEAVRLAQEGTAVARKALPPHHPDLARSLNHLGNALRENNRLAESEAVLREALDDAVRARGGEAPESTFVAASLAKTLVKSGRLDEAEKHFRANLAARRAKLGPNHPLVATALQDLAQLRQLREDRGEARALYEEALAIRTRAQGGNHQDSQALRLKLASLSTR